MRLVLFEPDIPQNTGALLRLAACWNLSVDVIFPCGFIFDDRRMKRAGMDYADHVDVMRHADWSAFKASRVTLTGAGRVILLSSKANRGLYEADFAPEDTLLMGSESAGVPNDVRDSCDFAVRIPLMRGLRSLNLGVAAGIALSEALRQTKGLPV